MDYKAEADRLRYAFEDRQAAWQREIDAHEKTKELLDEKKDECLDWAESSSKYCDALHQARLAITKAMELIVDSSGGDRRMNGWPTHDTDPLLVEAWEALQKVGKGMIIVARPQENRPCGFLPDGSYECGCGKCE